jgi:hypothetical protein
MNSAKKAEERRLVAHFVAAWSGGGAIATFDPNWKESPDFAGVLSDGRPFGLEVVTVTDKSLAKSGSDIHRRFVPELQAACLKRAVGALLHVSLQEWDAIRLGDRKHRRRLVERVADFVLEQRHHQETLERDALEARGIEGLDALTLYEETTGNVGVMVGRTAWGRGCDVVQDAIAAKDTKATAYRRRLGDGVELWLLVVAGTSFADGVEPPLKHITFDTTFDRVFFLNHWPVRHGKALDRVSELPIRRLPLTNPVG